MNAVFWAAGVAGGLVGALWVLNRLGERRWTSTVVALTERLGRRVIAGPCPRYDPAELDGLPAPVQRYFRTVLQAGQPIIASVSIDMTGRFKWSMTGQRWVAFTAHQRVQVRRPGFVWDARMVIGPGLPIRVMDSYVGGEGRLSVAVMGLLTVASAGGRADMDRAEFIRWLAEAAWYPTALLPSQGVRWQAVDDSSANATVKDGPLTVTLRCHFDAAGLISVIRFEARGALVRGHLRLLPWEARWTDYQRCHGMTLPMCGEVAWVLPQGPQTCFEGRVSAIRHEDAA